jgi:hypothetical protein
MIFRKLNVHKNHGGCLNKHFDENQKFGLCARISYAVPSFSDMRKIGITFPIDWKLANMF